jgi:signal peptidase I
VVAARHVACLALVMSVVAGCGDQKRHVYRIPSSAMEPTLHCGRPAPGCEGGEDDRILVVSYEEREPLRGDIVVFETPPKARELCGAGGLYVKRVIGLPLDHWRERSGRILVNGQELPEPWIQDNRRDDESFAGGELPPKHYLLLGDNRRASCDSRIFGPVPLAAIRGQVVEIKRGSKRIRIR